MSLILDQGESRVQIVKGFWPCDFESQINQIPLEHRQIKMFGKTFDEPRLTAWFGPQYTYSGVKRKASEMPPLLLPMLKSLETLTDFPFNCVLINCYRNGRDHMGWHRDNEKEINPHLIASLSFGATRKFKIRHRETRETWNVNLESGDLLLMYDLQHDFEHCLPKSATIENTRYNLTFRQIVSAD